MLKFIFIFSSIANIYILELHLHVFFNSICLYMEKPFNWFSCQLNKMIFHSYTAQFCTTLLIHFFFLDILLRYKIQMSKLANSLMWSEPQNIPKQRVLCCGLTATVFLGSAKCLSSFRASTFGTDTIRSSGISFRILFLSPNTQIAIAFCVLHVTVQRNAWKKTIHF